ncbi:hypothetical protein Sjap_002855 [Stephania japonica]|uniref:Uncharacterized protein n=1 Tax=Stephania japonica TaxID=461633 RepID=A0AAP0NK87_9MAGN
MKQENGSETTCEFGVLMGSSSVVLNDLNLTFLLYTPIRRDGLVVSLSPSFLLLKCLLQRRRWTSEWSLQM